jgi:hypothetical protein
MDVETATGVAGAGVTTIDANWVGEERLSITQPSKRPLQI